MLQSLKTFTTQILDPLGVWWDVVFGQKRRQRRWFNQIRREAGQRPALLIVDLKIDVDTLLTWKISSWHSEITRDSPRAHQSCIAEQNPQT